MTFRLHSASLHPPCFLFLVFKSIQHNNIHGKYNFSVKTATVVKETHWFQFCCLLVAINIILNLSSNYVQSVRQGLLHVLKLHSLSFNPLVPKGSPFDE